MGVADGTSTVMAVSWVGYVVWFVLVAVVLAAAATAVSWTVRRVKARRS